MHSIKRTLGSVALVGSLFVAGVGCSSSGSKASFCDQAKKSDVSNVQPSDGKKFTDLIDKLQSSAPSEIKGDLKTLADFLKELAKDPKAAAKDFDQAKITKASDNIKKYLYDECCITTS
jgi:hypothetical protein